MEGSNPCLEQLLKLKGIGEYTAAAIASFAFNRAHPVVDGNVFRVLSRIFDIETPIDSLEGKQVFSSIAQTMLPLKIPGIYNQAIMDFGATICKPKNPFCEICVQKKECEAFNNGYVSKLPVKEKKLKILLLTSAA